MNKPALFTPGDLNAFFGFASGSANTLGNRNSFFGPTAGRDNTNGSDNAFFGVASGQANTTGGNNSFFGAATGVANATGANNTLVGAGANVGAGNLNFATAIGSGALVSQSNTVVLGRSADTVQVPGALSVTGALNFSGALTGSGADLTNLNAANIATGTIDPARLGGATIINGTAQQDANFNILGNGTVGNTLTGGFVNARFNYQLDGQEFMAGNSDRSNTYVGFQTGRSPNSLNSFFGTLAGRGVTFGAQNSFFGASAGRSTSSGEGNSFFGVRSGEVNTTGHFNSIFGFFAGPDNTTGRSNSFFGDLAGRGNVTGNFNTALGAGAGMTAPGLTNATAIGSGALVSQSNSLVLGSIAGVNPAAVSTNVGIGTPAPLARLDVRGNVFVGLASNPLAAGENAVYINNDGGSVANTFRLDGANNFLYVVAASGGGANAGSGIVFRTGAAAGGEFDRVVIDGSGVMTLNQLGAAGATQLCRNASNQIATCSSSIRYKNNVQTYAPGLDLIRKLRPVSFNWKSNNTADFGLVAEEAAAAEPLLATYDEKGEVEGVKYDRVGVVLVNAVNEQQTQIENQQKQLDEQREIIKRQQSEIEALKALVCAQNKDASVCRQRQP